MRASLLLRLAALLFGLVYLPLGTVWAWWVAGIVLPVGLLGLWLLRLAERRAPRATCAPGERRLHQGALAVLVLAFVASGVSLGLAR
jgi:hypothetical protein